MSRRARQEPSGHALAEGGYAWLAVPRGPVVAGLGLLGAKKEAKKGKNVVFRRKLLISNGMTWVSAPFS